MAKQQKEKITKDNFDYAGEKKKQARNGLIVAVVAYIANAVYEYLNGDLSAYLKDWQNIVTYLAVGAIYGVMIYFSKRPAKNNMFKR